MLTRRLFEFAALAWWDVESINIKKECACVDVQSEFYLDEKSGGDGMKGMEEKPTDAFK